MFCLDFSSSIDQHHLMIQGLVAKHFKLSSIHDWQRNAITSALQGKDSFIVQPTGSGKSLCYAIPPLLAGKVAIVLSPTISLMCDQVHKMEKHGVSATFLGSAQKHDVINDLQKYTLVYTTPESFYDKQQQPRQVFLTMARNKEICLIAVDEAHLINCWKSFRYGIALFSLYTLFFNSYHYKNFVLDIYV